MKTFKITITDHFFPALSGEFTAYTKSQAINQAKEFYAMQLDTDIDYIEIVNVEQVN